MSSHLKDDFGRKDGMRKVRPVIFVSYCPCDIPGVEAEAPEETGCWKEKRSASENEDVCCPG